MSVPVDCSAAPEAMINSVPDPAAMTNSLTPAIPLCSGLRFIVASEALDFMTYTA